MEVAEQRKRNIAYKMRIGDVLKGKPVMEEGKFFLHDAGLEVKLWNQ